MLIGPNSEVPEAARHADALVVGAGAVGIALAVRLARSGLRVTLLEGGPVEPDAGYRARNAGRSAGRPHRGLVNGRMQALGGTTRLWGGQLVPFGRDDLERKRAPGVAAWPIGYDEYCRHVAHAFRFLGVPAPDAFGESAVAAALQRPAAMGPDLVLGLNLWLPQPDFARLFARDLRETAGLSVITGAAVQRLSFAPDGSVERVETRRGVFAGGQVVLACGTFEIVRLLLRAAACEASCGFAGNPHIGRWFIDHLHGRAGDLVGADPRRVAALFDYLRIDGHRFGVKVQATAALRARAGCGNGLATINPRQSARQMLGEFNGLVRRLFVREAGIDALTVARQGLTMLRIMLPLALRFVFNRRSGLVFARGITVGLEIEQLPCADSFIRLDPAFAPDVAPVELHWALDGREMDTVRALSLALRDALAEEGLGRLELDPRIQAGDRAYLDDMHDAFHQMGGARMAVSAEHGVVDPDLRVFGAPNLFVLGAAVFPTGSFANPTLTALALAMRLADRLLESKG